jgi:hypothetical protein
MKNRMILLVAVLALVATACGGSGDGDGSGVASLSTIDSGSGDSATGVSIADNVDPEQAMLDLTQCLRDQGIEIADPTVDAEGNPQLARPEFGEEGANEAFRTAIRGCGELLEGVTLGRQGLDFSALQDTLVEYAGCMRDNGYQMDDPDFSSFGQPPQDGEPGQGGGRIFGQFDLDDPEWQAANEACEDILAGFGPGGPGGGFGGGRPGGGS